MPVPLYGIHVCIIYSDFYFLSPRINFCPLGGNSTSIENACLSPEREGLAMCCSKAVEIFGGRVGGYAGISGSSEHSFMEFFHPSP